MQRCLSRTPPGLLAILKDVNAVRNRKPARARAARTA